MNKNMLNSKMNQFEERQENLAEAIGISLSRFNAKLNRRDGAQFTQDEIQIIKERYNLTSDEVNDIFFKPKVS